MKSRFGKKQSIINAHMNSLLKLKEWPNDSVDQLRKIYDGINVHVRGLVSLGMPAESYGNLLIPIIMCRMPRNYANYLQTSFPGLDKLRGMVALEM